jgi:hypothetical protein
MYRGDKWRGGSLGGGLESEYSKPPNQPAYWYSAGDTCRIEETIFETSEGTPHLWSPKAGDYRVLWQHTVWIYPKTGESEK